MIPLLWLDLARILVAGAVLGLVVGKLVADKPYYLERIRPRSWLQIARKMRKRDWFKLISIALAFTVASFLLATIIGIMLSEVGVQLYSEEEYTFTVLEKTSPILLLLTVNILPILEEWIFRGILLEEIAHRSHSRWLGVALSAVVFALFHLSNPGTYPAFAVPLIGAGILLGACYLYSGLAGAIIAHNAYNSILVILAI